jgi:PhzF family phenazine biosynthesis protein
MDSPLDEHLLMELLGSTLAAREARLPIQRSGPKVFVPLRSRQELFALRPDWDRLTAVGREHGVLGVFAFTRDTVEAGSLAHARYFTPAQGVREDPVTGAANGPLAEYLVVHGELPLPLGDGVVRARSEQGDAIGKPGRVDLEVRASAGAVVGVRIAGVAVTVVVGDVRLASPSGLGRGFASLLTGVRW